MRMRDYLIQPVQRIPRYVLLLEDIKNLTPPNHPDYENFGKLLPKIISIATDVNEKKREFEENVENQGKVVELQEKLHGFNLLEYPSLRYIQEAELYFVSKTIKKVKVFGEAISADN